MVQQEAVEERFVLVLDLAEKDVFRQVSRFGREHLVRSVDLLLKRVDVGREQPQ